MTAIEFTGVGKRYTLGAIGTGTLSHDLNRWWALARGREDPSLRVDQAGRAADGARQAWALRDITLSVEQGEVLGIIGKNGAGKSTLLKILSRVTSPTTGRIRARGRIASLLEVGTGFHPEMTGRENVYMNGCIMGMTRAEVTAKLDEIVDFAGVGRYIDTPVKRYSSGMTVRLGFAVAAHLEPEILVVDEVLAVGDAEFQRKAVGKMRDVSRGEGRTVLFVSHNMAAVKSLCTTGLVLSRGRAAFRGTASDALRHYLNEGSATRGERILDAARGAKPGVVFTRITLNGTESARSTVPSSRRELTVRIEGTASEPFKTDVMLVLKNKDGTPLAGLAEGHYRGKLLDVPAGPFTIEKTALLPRFLARGQLRCDLMLHHPMVEWQLRAPDCCVLDCEGSQEGFGQAVDQAEMGLTGLDTP